jgi:hypothetical protein
MNYWKWLFKGKTDDEGKDNKSGLRRFLDRWLVFHIFFAVVLSYVVPISLKDAANTVLLPLAGIFIGLSFAWGGNAQALLQTEEIRDFTEHHPGGFQEYVFVYQTAILLILITLILWGFAGFDIFDQYWPTTCRKLPYKIICALLFGFASLTVRECWHVVMGAQNLLLIRHRIIKKRKDKNKS